MVPGFEALVEERILKAQKNGDLDNLPGEGKPLALDDMNIPEEFRMAYRVLKNSGFLPPEVEIRNQIKKLEVMLNSIDDNERSNDKSLSDSELKRRSEIQKKLNFLLIKLNSNRGNSASPATLPATYRNTILKKISTSRRS